MKKLLSLLFRGAYIEYGPWIDMGRYQSRPATITIWPYHPVVLWRYWTYKGKPADEDYILLDGVGSEK